VNRPNFTTENYFAVVNVFHAFMKTSTEYILDMHTKM